MVINSGVNLFYFVFWTIYYFGCPLILLIVPLPVLFPIFTSSCVYDG